MLVAIELGVQPSSSMASGSTRSQQLVQLIQILDTLFCDHLNTAESLSLSLCCSELYHALLPYRVRTVRCSPVRLQRFAELLKNRPSCARFCKNIIIMYYDIEYDSKRVLGSAELLKHTAETIGWILCLLAEHGLQRFEMHMPKLLHTQSFPIDPSLVEKASATVWDAMVLSSETLTEISIYMPTGFESHLNDWGYAQLIV